MADVKIDVDLVPKLDERALYATMQKLGTAIDKASPARGHKILTRQLAGLFSGMVDTGRFPTLSSAATFFRQATGGHYSPEKTSIITSGVALARSQKQLEQATLNFEKRFSRTERGFADFTDYPTMRGKNNLLESIETLESEGAALLKSYKKSGEKIPDILKNANKKTEKWQKEVLKAKVPFGGTGVGTIAAGTALGIGLEKIAEWALKHGIEAMKTGMARGDKDITEQMVYGENRDIASTRAYANLYQMDENAVADVQRRMMTYRERLKWGQVSQGEMIMWSRLGLGGLVSSGEAARNPRSALAAYFGAQRGYIGNESELLSILQSGGIDPQLMKANAKQFSQEELAREMARQEENVAREKFSGMETMGARAWWKRLGESATANVSSIGATLLGAIFGGGETARNMHIFSKSERGTAYNLMTPENKALVEGRNPNLYEKLVSNPLTGSFREPIAAGNQIFQTFYNTFNNQGADSEELSQKIVEQQQNEIITSMNASLGTKRGL